MRSQIKKLQWMHIVNLSFKNANRVGKPLYFYKKKRKSRKGMGALCSEIRVAAQHMGIIGRRLLFLQLGTVREHGSNSLATQLRSSLQRLPITKEEFLYFVHHN